MAKPLHPHENKGNMGNFTPTDDERLDPSELERYELLEQFLSQCRHPGLKAGDQVSDFIVSTLRSGPENPWGYHLKQLQSDLDIQTVEEMGNQDEIYARILELIMYTKANVVRGEGISIVRKALFELLDLRAGVISQFDKKLLMNERNEMGWNDTLDKVVPNSP